MKATFTTHNLAADAKAGSQDACTVEAWRDAVIGVVADGVGGAEHAREAAERVVESLVTNFKSRPKSWSVARALEEFTRLINRTLYQESLARCERPELLTTLAVAVLEGDQLYGLNVGDSRVYLFRTGQLRQLSEDHAETETQFKHVLQRAVGMAAEVTAFAFTATIQPGDVVLLCSDGLSNVLPAEKLSELLLNHASARTLVATARESAQEEQLDDTSAAVIQVLETGSLRNLNLEVPGTLRVGQLYDGCRLVRPLNPTERAWIAHRDSGDVVVKFAPERARDDAAVHDQFAKEIWSVTRFEADYFIRAFVPVDNRTFCYCMEYVQAPTLNEAVKASPFTAAEAVALLEFLLAACQFLAGQDLVHGDLKPDNILVLRASGKVNFKLIDFGSITEFFSTTTRAGTPSFLAPERFRSAPISERTEIFALGVTLFFALTGRLPYGEVEPFQTPVFRTPQRLTKLNPHLPPWLESIALRAIAVAPEDRYQSYSEMKFDLAHPDKVAPWFRRSAPLLERDPLLFYRTGFFLLLALSLFLFFRLWLR